MRIEQFSMTPAYGRDYASADEVKKAWESGADFRIQALHISTYCSIRDVEYIKRDYKTKRLQFRFNKQQDIHIINI